MLLVFALVFCVFSSNVASAYTNPFTDVPLNSWAYDAVAQLSARGVVSGYADGTYKGNQPMTRYEFASAVARALAKVDLEKASKQDIELLKKLVVEFKDELDALGVKVDQLDKRVAVLEENIGGWKINGEFRMDAKFGDNKKDSLYSKDGSTDFSISRYRLWFNKKINDKVSFTSRLTDGDSNAKFDLYYITVMLPWDVKMVVGRYQSDWECEDKLYTDEDAFFTDRYMTGFFFDKSFGMWQLSSYVTHREGIDPDNDRLDEGYEYGIRAKIDFTEKLWLSANYLKRTYGTPSVRADFDSSVWWIASGYKYNPNIEVKAAYFNEKDDSILDSDNTMWMAIVDVKQEALKYTSLWAQYIKINDPNFTTWTSGAFDSYSMTGELFSDNLGLYDNIMYIKMDQMWNDKFGTFVRYINGDARSDIASDTKCYTFGVKYFYTPGLSFELAYDKTENAKTITNNDDNVIRLRTHVTF